MKKTVRTLIVMVISVLMLTIATIPAMAADFDSETTNDNVTDFIKQMCKELKECNYKGNITLELYYSEKYKKELDEYDFLKKSYESAQNITPTKLEYH